MRRQGSAGNVGSVLVIAIVFMAGCCTVPPPPPSDAPRELDKATHPEYRIAPPDILVINAVRVIPKPPFKIQPLDVLSVSVTPSLPDQPISGAYPVEPSGTIDLGPSYGTVQVTDLTLPEAKAELANYLKDYIKGPLQVSVSLGQSRAQQQIRGEHLVKQDGTIGLGTYGAVPVAGLTLKEAKSAVEFHLSQFLVKPELSVDVSGFNSRVYYVITDGGGYGEQVYRLPITGNETVLDGIGQIYGLSIVSSKYHIWVARPTPMESACDQVLPVDWIAITQRGQTATNYQLFPGDRIYVKAQAAVTTDTYLARFISPIERIFGIILLGKSTFGTMQNGNNP